MADKDEFKFDDDDAFPETDLSGAFSEGEQAAPEVPDYPMTIKKSGGNRTKLLAALLLVLVAGGGAYYYFVMNKPAPPPSPPPRKPVAVAPKPAAAPVPQPAAPAAGQAQGPATPPPAKPGAVAQVPAPVPAPAPAPAPVAVAPPPKPAGAVAVAVPAPAKPAPAPAPVAAAPAAKPAVSTPAPVPAPAPAKPAVATAPAPAKPAPAAAPVPAPPKAAPVAADGPWMVEAGTYLNAAALKTAEKKVRGLGYEPQVTTKQKSVRLTRLRIGSYPESELKEALAYARGIAPDAFSIRSGDTFTLYAGTFANPQNIREMSERLVGEGVQVEEEPVEIKRTISLLRFGGFPDQAAAADAAARARKAGIAAEVVKPR
ncbi:MAG: SPOR domain-containing protein [Deltaproteobacteria bacterium]|nr:MAG: SPOR domain-containing protein [Deltaproteobacteria bacterium]